MEDSPARPLRPRCQTDVVTLEYGVEDGVRQTLRFLGGSTRFAEVTEDGR